MMKRFLSMILALMMVLSMLPAQALATELPEVEAEEIVLETQTPETEPATEPVPATESAPAETVPATEPAPAETVPATEPAPATEPVPATEPAPAETVPATEPVPAETVSGQVTDEPALSGTVNIGIIRDDGTSTSIEVTLGDTFVLPAPGEGDQHYEFLGWMLVRSDGARFMEDDRFEDINAIDPDSKPKYFPTGTVFDTDDFDFEDYNGYSFNECWTFTGTYTWVRFYPTVNEDDDGFGENVVVGDPITIPAHGVEGATDTFEGWFLLREDGAWYTESGSFTKNASTASKIFQPNETFVLAEELFEDEYTSFYFYGIWKNHVMFRFLNGMTPMSVAYGETLTFPAYGETAPGYQFAGWTMERSDNTGLTVNMEFSDEWVDPLQTYPENGTLDVTSTLFDNSKYIYYISGHEMEIPDPSKFYIGFYTTGHWEDPSWGEEAHLGETLTIPAYMGSGFGSHTEPAGWFLTRGDGARYTADGTFTTDDSVASRVFVEGDTLKLDEALFDPENNNYTFYAIWEDAVAIAFSDGQPAQVVNYDGTVTLPQTCAEEMENNEFCGWHLTRNDNACLGESGSFSVEWVEPYKTYEPGAVVTVSSTLFDNTRYTYIFTPAWREVNDPNKLSINFFPNNGGDSQREMVSFGEEFVIPDYDDFDGLDFVMPDADFTGWFLQRDDGAWYTAGGSFTTEESVESRIFTADEKVTFDADAFDNEKYDYYFRGIWDGVVTFMFAGRDAVAVEFGKSITFPENTQTMEGFEFGYFELSRSDGKWLCTDGTFRDDYEVASKEFYPDDSFEVSADLFDTSKYTYHIGDIFFKIKDPNVLNGNFMPDSNSENNFGADISLTEEFEVPDHGIDAADGVFEGWLLLREYDGAWYTEDGTFSMNPDDAPCIFVPGETVQLNAAAFDTLEYYYSFYGIWEDTITFYFWDGHEPVAVTYGEELTFPYDHWAAFPPSFEIFGWVIVRNDGAVLMEDGTFSLDEDGNPKIFDEGESYKIKEEAFNNKDYIYYISSYGQEVPDEDVIEFFFSPTGSFMFGQQETGYIGEDFVIPEYELNNPGFEFEGWLLMRDIFDEENRTTTTARYSTSGSFTTKASAASKIFKPGDTLKLASTQFKKNDYTSYSFYGVWKDAVNFMNDGNGETMTVAYGDEVVFPQCTEESDGTKAFDGWIIYRSDGALLTADGKFSSDWSKRWQWFYPNETLAVTEDLFDNTRYCYYISSTWSDIEAITTEELLREQLASDVVDIEINTNLTLTEDLVIPEGKKVFLWNGVTLTVPAGITLDVQGDTGLRTFRGTIKVEPNGKLRAGVPYAIYLGDYAVLDVTGADLDGVVSTAIGVEEEATVYGIETTRLARFNIVRNMAEVKAGLELADDYALLNINCIGTFTITEDLTIPENVCFVLQSWTEDGGETYKPGKVTLAAGKTLTVEGDIEIYDTCVLTVAKGANLICDGTIYLYYTGKLTNNGKTVAYLDSIAYIDGGTVSGNNEIIYKEDLFEIDSIDAIGEAYADGASDISVFYSNIEIAEDLKLPDDLKLTFVDCEITVGEGVTVSGGELELWESTLYLDGMYEGGEVMLDNVSRVVPEEKIVSSREEDDLFYVKLGWPKATGIAVKNSDGNTVSGTTVTVDMKETPTYQLKSITEPALASDEASWKTSSATIATVDANGLVTFKKPGAVTITATAKDGSKKTATVKFSVSFLDTATKLTATADVPEIGLQTGYMAEMIVSGTDVIDPANLIYSSSDNAIATVEEGVIIAGEKLGTATITAAIAGDPLNRKVTLKVKVIALQTEELNLALEGVDSFEEVTMLDENGNVTDDPAAAAELLLDKEDVTTENNTFHIDYEAIGYNFAPVPLALNEMDSGVKLDPGVKWVSSDTRIATVTPDETGALVTLKADGVVTITAVTNDLSKVEKSLTVAVRDYTPRLGATSLTMNSYLESGVDVALLESYGKKIEDVALYEYDTVAKDYAEETSDRLMPDYNDGVLNITPADGVELKNGTIKLLLKVTVEGGKTYEYKITLKVANTLPAITVKQASKINLFYTDSVAVLNVTAKDAVITGVTMENTDAFTLIPDGETGEMLICNENVEGKPDTSATLVVELEGYRVPATKNFTISTVTTKPSLVLTATSSTISTYLPDSDPTTSFSIKDKSTGEILYLWDATVETLATDIATCEIQEDLETIQLTLRANKGGTSAIYVQYPYWADPIKLTHKITVKSTLPTPSLSASTVKLNNILTDITAQTTVKLNQSNWEIENVALTATGKAAAIEEAKKIVWEFDKDTATINFSLDSENLPEAGTYSFDYVVSVRDEDKVIELPKKTLKVSVSETAPTVKLQSATVKLNKTIGNDSMAMTAVTLANAGEYWLYDLLPVVPEGAEYPFELYFNYDYGIDGMIFVNMKDDVDVENLPNSKYTVELQPVLMGEYEKVELKKTVKLTVQIFSGKPSITVTAKGKLDTINPDSEIVYTISKITNLPGELYDVELLGEDAELFDYSPVMIGAKYGISLTKKDGAVLATNKTYKLQFNISTIWPDENDESRTYTVPVDISFKPTQSSLKFAKIPTLNLYQSSDLPLRCNVALTAPAGAVLDESSITLGSKTAAQFIRAVGDGELIYDPQSGELNIDIENPGALTYGKSYTVYLDVTPVGNASNVKPTQLKLTVKVFK